MTPPNTTCCICKKPIYRIPSRLCSHNACSIACRNRWFSKERSPTWKGGPATYRSTRNSYEKQLRDEHKLKAIRHLGGKCSTCGYDKCPAALDFHHTNPKQKDFTLSRFSRAAWNKLQKELEKCILLCANCHRELHWKENNES